MFTTDTQRQNVVFVDPLPEELRCPFHRGIFEEPQVGLCGHSFCKLCLHLEDDSEITCPICMTNLSKPFFPNLAIEAVISHLRVYCRNRDPEKISCQAIVTLGELPVHEQTCEFSPKGDIKNETTTGNYSKYKKQNRYHKKSITYDFSFPKLLVSKKPIMMRIPSQHMWHIDFREIKLLYRIGLGAFGEVFKGSFRGTVVAVKRIIAKGLKENEREEMFKKELEFMKLVL